MKLVEVAAHDNFRVFRWTKGKNEVAYISLYADGLVEFHSKATGNRISIERVGEEDEELLIDQLSIRVGSVDQAKAS